ncbi:1642_t:CDS:2 [Gigaspora rosea]|nr:1642_t:CDS:2 [Gigaspora rosea]
MDLSNLDVNRILLSNLKKEQESWLDLMLEKQVENTHCGYKKRKIDGVLKVLKIKKVNHQIIGIVEFSKDIKSSDIKDIDNKVKLCRNAMRILNKLLDTVPCGFEDMSQFATDVAILMNFLQDILMTVKTVKKSTEKKNVYKSDIETTPEKRKRKEQVNTFYKYENKWRAIRPSSTSIMQDLRVEPQTSVAAQMIIDQVLIFAIKYENKWRGIRALLSCKTQESSHKPAFMSPRGYNAGLIEPKWRGIRPSSTSIKSRATNQRLCLREASNAGLIEPSSL